MFRRFVGVSLLLAPIALAACEPQPPQPASVIIQPQASAAPQAPIMVPNAPPPAQAELVPPPPQGSGSVAWQPGHWRFTGEIANQWAWVPGHYVPVPPGQSVWVPGRWIQQPSGGWVWSEGHWA